MPRDLLCATSNKKDKLFTGNEPGRNQEKQRRNHISKEKNNEVLKSEFMLKKWAHLIQFVVTTARLNEKGLMHNVPRNLKQEL